MQVAAMKQVEYEAPDGRLYAVLIPEDAPDSAARMGIVVGPPELDSLSIPNELMVAVHNQLYHRKIFTYGDARRHRGDIQLAILTALKNGLVADILNCYERVNHDAISSK